MNAKLLFITMSAAVWDNLKLTFLFTSTQLLFKVIMLLKNLHHGIHRFIQSF